MRHRVGHPALLLLLLASTAHADATSVTLQLWDVPQKGRGNVIPVARRRVFEAFCREHPEVQVKALVPLDIEGPASWGQMFLAVAARAAGC